MLVSDKESLILTADGAREDCAEVEVSVLQVSNKTNNKLQSVQIHHPYSSPNITWVMKSQQMR